jgi:transposase-like protein
MMNLIKIFKRFPDQEACIEHLEDIRFKETPYCPHCGSTHVARKHDGHRIGRWNCHDCKSSFNVLSGTIFEKTKIPLQKWFLAIGLIVNAKKSLSSCQLARDLELNQKTAWYMQQRIRAQMAAEQTKETGLLQGIVEADETYVGGKPRKRNNKDLTPPL